MQKSLILASIAIAAFLLAPGAAKGLTATSDPMVDVAPWETVGCEDFSPEAIALAGGVVSVAFTDPSDGSTVTVDVTCYQPGASGAFDNDCTSTAYSLTGWRWSSAFSAKADPTSSGLSASGVVSQFNTNGKTWDGSTGASIMGTVTQGGTGSKAGRHDGVNQFGWKSLGGGGTIAVTYTWSSGGLASESDAAYNTFFPWSLTGEANKMDLGNIGTHEIGHTFGMGHTTTASQNACLTMYPYGDYGETIRRTLGQGDINGIKAIYG